MAVRDRRLGLETPDGKSRKPDHDVVNAVLEMAYQRVVDEVERRYDPLPGVHQSGRRAGRRLPPASSWSAPGARTSGGMPRSLTNAKSESERRAGGRLDRVERRRVGAGNGRLPDPRRPRPPRRLLPVPARRSADGLRSRACRGSKNSGIKGLNWARRGGRETVLTTYRLYETKSREPRPVRRRDRGATTRGDPPRSAFVAGLTHPGVRRRVTAGHLHRLYRGVYAVGHTELSREGRWTLPCSPSAPRPHEPRLRRIPLASTTASAQLFTSPSPPMAPGSSAPASASTTPPP